jgi:geranylgeranyl reductase family protein
MYDVIVVGAGPSGSFISRKLSEKGHKVQVLEARAQAGEKSSCTGIVGWEFITTFGIDPKVVMRRADSATIFSPGGHKLHLMRPEPQACILDRKAFDVYMAEQAQRAGAEYLFNCRAGNITAEKDRVKITVSQAGKESTLEARAAVLATGFNPGLAERAGLGSFGDYVTGVQAEVAAPGLEEVEVYFGDMAPGFFAWLAPTASGTAKAGLLSRREPGALLKKWLNQLERQGRITSQKAELHYGGIPLKPPARTYNDRMIAVGDAAGHAKPTSGGGIYYGLIGAEIGAGVLHKALTDGDLTAGRLARYEKAWRKKLGKELCTGYWARRLYERLSNEQIDLLFKIIKTSGIDEALLKADDLSFDWHSRTIMSLLKYKVVAGTLKIIKLPFRNNHIDR